MNRGTTGSHARHDPQSALLRANGAKIDIFDPITADQVRLNLLSTTDAAQIREFALYDSRKAKHLP